MSRFVIVYGQVLECRHMGHWTGVGDADRDHSRLRQRTGIAVHDAHQASAVEQLPFEQRRQLRAAMHRNHGSMISISRDAFDFLHLAGKFHGGLRALDIVRSVELLADRADVDSQSIAGIGIARGSIPLLYAAVFDGRIHSLDLDGMLASYSSIVDSRLHRNVFEQILPGVIRHFDLPDLVAAMAPRKVSLRGLVEAMGDPAPSEMVDKLYGRLAR